MRSELTDVYATRVAIVSPPRTGSTAVARLLWQHPDLTHHCHEPFEACYWGSRGFDAVESCLRWPMEIATGRRVPLAEVPGGSGLLMKEMTFQLDSTQLELLVELATPPVVFVMSDPRLSTTSRLRIVGDLYGTTTFPPFESGWQSLREHIDVCSSRGVPYVLVDSDDLRADPVGMTATLIGAVGLRSVSDLATWEARPGLQLCAPEVGALMSEARRADDPFYRRVLASTGVEPRDAVDWDRETALISSAGLSREVDGWLAMYEDLRADRGLLTTSTRGAGA